MKMQIDFEVDSIKGANDLPFETENIKKLDDESLRCRDCDIDFSTNSSLYCHLLRHHVQQPSVRLAKLVVPPIKITLKGAAGGNIFAVVQSPTTSESNGDDDGNLDQTALDEAEDVGSGGAGFDDFDAVATLDDIDGIIENERMEEAVTARVTTDDASTTDVDSNTTYETITGSEPTYDTVPDVDPPYETVPGAEPTPPPDPSPESPLPKIRIKTTGLLKELHDNHEESGNTEKIEEIHNGDRTSDVSDHESWESRSIGDSLRLNDNDDNIISLLNNNDRAKDFGFTTSDPEFMPMDRLDTRNNNDALQLYNPPVSSVGHGVSALAGLPMQALAQQVSRLQPTGGGGLHQQNVLINIQQFPQTPPQPPYQPPPMHHYSGQPMYPPYQYQHPPNQLYYPGPSYPPPPRHMQQQQPRPQPQMPNVNQQAPPPLMPLGSQNAPNQNPGLKQQPPFPHHPQNARQPMMRPPMPTSHHRMPVPRGLPTAVRQRQPMTRPRGPIQRPMRPTAATRMISPQKRMTQEAIKQEAKRQRFDLVTSGKDDDDCQVICVQPKTTDGLPQIESVQGAASETGENNIVHLSDSITLSVRNPTTRASSPKGSDAKAVANILATRGITVTPAAKPKQESAAKTNAVNNPTSLNLNGAVSIVPSKQQQKKTASESLVPPTVDLTDEQQLSPIKQTSTSPSNVAKPALPFRCYLCPAQYPNVLSLNRHRQNYHKCSPNSLDMGIPLVNLKQPGVMQRLSQIGIQSFIPLSAQSLDGTFALPVISARNPGNVAALNSTSMLVLGPIKMIPRNRPPQPQLPNKPNGIPPQR